MLSCWGVCIRRGRVLLKKSSSGMQLPAATGHSEFELLKKFEQELGVELGGIGPLEPLDSGPNHQWCFLTLMVAPEVTYDARVDDKGLCWVPLSDWASQHWGVSGPSKEFLDCFLSDPGNAYTLVQTTGGKPTFAHLATGEILHSQAGPFEEAEQLYVLPLGIREKSGTYTLYDCGLGCGTLVIAFVDAYLKNDKLTNLRVASFDLEKKGLVTLLMHLDKFPEAAAYKDFVQQMIDSDHFIYSFGSKQVEFRFVQGDFKESIFGFEPDANWKADGICYDFFSPFNQTELWSVKVLAQLYTHCSPQCLLSTYSSATAVRASFLAAGFYLGEGTPSGKKNGTTLAAIRIQDLPNPLGPKFLQTFLRSQKPYFENLPEAQKAFVKDKVTAHPQFGTF